MQVGFPILFILVFQLGCGAATVDEPPPADPLSETTAEELFETGISFADRGDFVRAEQYLSAAMDQGYPESEALPALVKVCLVSQRYRSALGYAMPYLDRHPRAWRLRYLVASIHLGIGNQEEARKELETVVEQVPNSARPRYLLAVVLRDSTDEAEMAELHFRRYLELAPDGDHEEEVRASLRSLERVKSKPVPVPVPAETEAPADAADDQLPDAPPTEAPSASPEGEPGADQGERE